MSRAWFLPAVLAGLAALGVAAIGGTITNLDGWYRTLHQPSWSPPDQLFPIAWTLIFALAAIAAVSAWRAAPGRRDVELMIGLFALNGFLNILWSLLFFRMQRPDWALVELCFLWLSIAALIFVCGRYSRIAAILLVPYLAWVTIAGLLNWEIVRLNGPFA